MASFKRRPSLAARCLILAACCQSECETDHFREKIGAGMVPQCVILSPPLIAAALDAEPSCHIEGYFAAWTTKKADKAYALLKASLLWAAALSLSTAASFGTATWLLLVNSHLPF